MRVFITVAMVLIRYNALIVPSVQLLVADRWTCLLHWLTLTAVTIHHRWVSLSFIIVLFFAIWQLRLQLETCCIYINGLVLLGFWRTQYIAAVFDQIMVGKELSQWIILRKYVMLRGSPGILDGMEKCLTSFKLRVALPDYQKITL